MAYLGTPYRFVYEAKNYRTGLVDVLGYVMKPNNSMAGPYLMTELLPFVGVYGFDYITTPSDPAGEYLALIVSPTEGLRSTARASLSEVPNFDQAFADLEEVIDELNQTIVVLQGEVVAIGGLLTSLSQEVSDINDAIEIIVDTTEDLQSLTTTIASSVVTSAIVSTVEMIDIEVDVFENETITAIIETGSNT